MNYLEEEARGPRNRNTGVAGMSGFSTPTRSYFAPMRCCTRLPPPDASGPRCSGSSNSIRRSRLTAMPTSVRFVVDVFQVWRRSVVPFEESGSPATGLHCSLLRRGRIIADFPFMSGQFVLHLGQGTLSQIHAAGERSNPYFEWAESGHGSSFSISNPAWARDLSAIS